MTPPKISLIVFLFAIVLPLVLSCSSGGGGDDDDDDDDDSGDDDDDTGDDDTGDDDTGDDDTGDDDDNDTGDDDTGDDDDDTYPTHEEIFNLVGNITVNGSSEIALEFGLGETGAVFSSTLVVVDTVTDEELEVGPTWDVEPGDPNYCVALLEGTYDLWMKWSGYNNSNYQYFTYTTQVADDLLMNTNAIFDINHVMHAVTGRAANFEDADVEFQRVRMFTAAKPDEAFNYYDFTDEDGRYLIHVPAGSYTFSVDIYDEPFDVRPYVETGVAVTGDLTKDVVLPQSGDTNAVTGAFTVNGADPTAAYDTVSGKMRLTDEAGQVTYFDFCEGDCGFYAPDGVYTLSLELTLEIATEPAFSVTMFETYSSPVTVSGATTLPAMDIALHAVSGAVLDSNGDPLPDVEIAGQPHADGQTKPNFTATSAAAGAYRVHVPTDSYEVNYTPPAGAPFEYEEFEDPVEVSGPLNHDYEFPEDYVTLSGVFTINDDPLSSYFSSLFTSARVQLLDVSGNVVRTITADPATGAFTGDVPVGTYDLGLLYQGARIGSEMNVEVLVVAHRAFLEDLVIDGDTVQDLDLEMNTVTGTVLDWNSSPLDTAVALFESVLNEPLVCAEALVGADGAYSMWLPPAAYDVTFVPPACGNLIPLYTGETLIEDDMTIDFLFP